MQKAVWLGYRHAYESSRERLTLYEVDARLVRCYTIGYGQRAVDPLICGRNS